MHTEPSEVNATGPKIILTTVAFELGTVATTRSIWHWMKDSPRFSAFVASSLARHAAKDWGDLDQEDKDANERDLVGGFRLLSCYNVPASCPETRDRRIYIITEADRSATTVLFPSEY